MTLFAAAFIVIANLVVDILYAFVDPKVRLLLNRGPTPFTERARTRPCVDWTTL